jgi:quercetin dioxygenase-like cupin family protein
MTFDQGSYGSTSGTDTRDARPLMDRLMVFSLQREAEALQAEEPYQNGDRNSATLAKEVDFRVLLTVLRSGAALDEQDGDARTSIQVLDGTATLSVGGSEEADVVEHDVAVIDAGQPWLLRATSDCAVLLTLARPRDKAGV